MSSQDSTENPVRCVIAGYGWWGQTLFRWLKNSKLLKVNAVVEPIPEVRARAQADGADVSAADLSQAVQRRDIDAVILCTPHPAHPEQIETAAAAGKHVFCEKPLSLTLDPARKAVAAINARSLVLGIGHERRFEPAVIELRQAITAGRLGNVLQIEANFSQDKFFALPPDNWRFDPKLSPGGPLTATGIHLVDLAVAILGSPSRVKAKLRTIGSNFRNGDSLAIMMDFPTGQVALISAILATPFVGRFAVYGNKGWVEIRDRTHPESPTGWDVVSTYRGQTAETRSMDPYPAVLANLESFARAVKGLEPYPVSDAELLGTVASLEAILRSIDSGEDAVVESI
jgi:predicted dehydrogenase